ncbi:MAG: hypothetical protein ABJG42_24040 [Vibrio splendidus]
MTVAKPFSRAEIVKRFRRRKKIFRDEAANSGLVPIEVWLTEETVSLMGEPVAEQISATVEEAFSIHEHVSASERMARVEARAFVRQKKEGLS